MQGSVAELAACDLAARAALGLALVEAMAMPSRGFPGSYLGLLGRVRVGLSCVVLFLLVAASEGTGKVVAGGVLLATAWAAAVLGPLGLRGGGRVAAACGMAAAALLLAAMPGQNGVDPPATLVAGRILSGSLIGMALAAMLLGHHDLVHPGSVVDALEWVLGAAFVALLARVAVGLAVAAASHAGGLTMMPGWTAAGILTRWVVGGAVPAVGLLLARGCIAHRNIQAATGILYATFAGILLGETLDLIAGADLLGPAR
jgi:hypothetical protein